MCLRGVNPRGLGLAAGAALLVAAGYLAVAASAAAPEELACPTAVGGAKLETDVGRKATQDTYGSWTCSCSYEKRSEVREQEVSVGGVGAEWFESKGPVVGCPYGTAYESDEGYSGTG